MPPGFEILGGVTPNAVHLKLDVFLMLFSLSTLCRTENVKALRSDTTKVDLNSEWA